MREAPLTRTAIVLHVGCGILGWAPSAHGNAYLMQPVSRALFYTPAFQKL